MMGCAENMHKQKLGIPQYVEPIFFGLLALLEIHSNGILRTTPTFECDAFMESEESFPMGMENEGRLFAYVVIRSCPRSMFL